MANPNRQHLCSPSNSPDQINSSSSSSNPSKSLLRNLKRRRNPSYSQSNLRKLILMPCWTRQWLTTGSVVSRPVRRPSRAFSIVYADIATRRSVPIIQLPGTTSALTSKSL
jgi:hypothetical protein